MKKINKLFWILIIGFLVNSVATAQTLRPKKKGDHYIYLNKKNKPAFKKKFADAKGFSEGLAAVKIEDQWGFINKKGKLVIPAKFQKAGYFLGSSTIVKEKGQFQIIDQTGNTLSEVYDSISWIPDYYILKKSDVFGIADSKGIVLAKPKYQSINGFYKNQFTIKLNDKWGSWKAGVENFSEQELFFATPDQWPIFAKECAKITDAKERKYCSDQKMLQKLYRNIKYPSEARNNGFSGTVVVRFIIDKEGNTINHEVIKSIGGGCDEECIRVTKTFITGWFKPGMLDNVPVNTIFNLPIKFRLE